MKKIILAICLMAFSTTLHAQTFQCDNEKVIEKVTTNAVGEIWLSEFIQCDLAQFSSVKFDLWTRGIKRLGSIYGPYEGFAVYTNSGGYVYSVLEDGSFGNVIGHKSVVHAKRKSFMNKVAESLADPAFVLQAYALVEHDNYREENRRRDRRLEREMGNRRYED